MGWFDSEKENEEEETRNLPETTTTTTTTTPVLMEVVSARDLSRRKSIDPYCTVRCGKNKKVCHKTKTIYNDPDPIWTCLTGSLCILQIPRENDDEETETEASGEERAVVVEVRDGSQCIGMVTVPFRHALNATGEREEYLLQEKKSSSARQSKKGDDDKLLSTLVLRFRPATSEDIDFFRKREEEVVDKSQGKGLGTFQRRHRITKDRKMQFRVQPGPDPDRVEETTWMTEKEIRDEALKSSQKWMEVGSGEIGRVYLEIIGCNKLPDLDVGVGDKTDPFVGVVFEDSMVRTDILYDTLSPRWMPWTTRAFAFNIAHPSSLLFLGVFDYDPLPVKHHDPAGRVVINTANFQSNTSYLLHYTLHSDPHGRDNCGRIIIRLRVEWKSESEARKLAMSSPPPRFLINVESERSFNVLRYICQGKVNMEKATMETCKLYAKELKSYGTHICFTIDVIVNILLWRGRAIISLGENRKISVWFPIHSVVLLAAAIVAIEIPFLVPTVVLYGIAWILLTINYHGSRYPYPWNRCKSCNEINSVLILGKNVHGPVRISPKDGVYEAKAMEDLDQKRAQRIANFLREAKTVGLKVMKVYRKSSVSGYSLQTEDRTWHFLSNHLTYVHMMLKYICTFVRSFLNFINWRGYYAHSLTMTCVILGTAWLILPIHILVRWFTRIVAYTLLGPWMKLVDIYWVHPYYLTTEELQHTDSTEKPNLDWILTSETLHKMGASSRIASEDALKLKDMRHYKFGKLSQRVPHVDASRYPSIPLPQSTAQPYKTKQGRSSFVRSREQQWQYLAGQKLEGDMIHTQKRKSNVDMEF